MIDFIWILEHSEKILIFFFVKKFQYFFIIDLFLEFILMTILDIPVLENKPDHIRQFLALKTPFADQHFSEFGQRVDTVEGFFFGMNQTMYT